jgi:hypothetical protein
MLLFILVVLALLGLCWFLGSVVVFLFCLSEVCHLHSTKAAAHSLWVDLLIVVLLSVFWPILLAMECGKKKN